MGLDLPECNGPETDEKVGIQDSERTIKSRQGRCVWLDDKEFVWLTHGRGPGNVNDKRYGFLEKSRNVPTEGEQ